MKFKYRHIAIVFVSAVVVAITYRLFFASFSFPQQGAPNGIPVTVEEVTIKKTNLWQEFSGTIVAVEEAKIKPQVSGKIEKILFKEGSQVKKGDSLFTIDSRPYLAELKKAEADLTAARSSYATALKELERSKTLIKEKAISQKEFEEKQNSFRTANAAVLQAESYVNIAKLNVEYANVIAPISGVVGRAEVTVGNLVNPSDDITLTTIVASDNLYAEFSIDEQTYVKYSAHNELTEKSEAKIPVKILLAGEEKPSHTGYITSFDNKLDPSTGTIRARALIKNKNGDLIPGLFARIILGDSKKSNVIAITDRAIGTDQDKKFVYVVNSENKAEYRIVKIAGLIDGLRVIEDGLKSGEKIVVNGMQSIRPGVKIIDDNK